MTRLTSRGPARALRPDRRSFVLIFAALSLALTAAAAVEQWRRPGDVLRVLVRIVLPSVLAGGAAAALAERRRASYPVAPHDVLPRTAVFALSIIVVAGGATIRIWGFADFPPPEGTGYEEQEIGGVAGEILRVGHQPPEHWLPAWAVTAGFRVFGASIPSMRAPFVLVSALSPLLLLLAARHVASREVALFVTALWAVAWWPILAGRIADEIFFTAPLQLLALALLFRARDAGSPLAGWGAGLICGLFLTEYTAYHAFPLIVPAGVGIAAASTILRSRRAAPGRSVRDAAREVLRPHAATAGAYFLAFASLALPLASSAARARSLYFAEGVVRHMTPASAVLKRPWPEYCEILVLRVRNLWAATHRWGCGEDSPWLNPGRAPMVDGITCIAIGAGLALLTASATRRRHGLILSLVAIPAIVFLTVPQNENFMRYFVILPLAFLGAAAGLDVAWRRSSRRVRVALLVAGTATIAVAAPTNIHRALFVVPRNSEVTNSYRNQDVVLASWVGARETASRTVFLTDLRGSEFPDVDVLRWLLRGRSAKVAETLGEALQERPAPGSPVYLVAFGIPEQPGLEEILARTVGPPAPATQIPTSDRSVSGRAWRIHRPACEEPIRLRGAVDVKTWSGPGGPPGPGPIPPSTWESISSGFEPGFSVLAIPLSVKHAFPDGPRVDGVHLWAALAGVPDAEGGPLRSLEIQARGGETWLWAGETLLANLAARDTWQTVRANAPAPDVPVRLLYRHDGPDQPGVQLLATGADGRTRVATSLASSIPEVSLSSLAPDSEKWGFAAPRLNRSAGDEPIRVDGAIRVDGLGLHSPGRATWRVPATASRFLALVGVQPQDSCGASIAEVSLYLDDSPEAISEVRVVRGEPGHPIDVDVRGARRMTLIIGEGPDGRDCDHVNLAEARFLLAPCSSPSR